MFSGALSSAAVAVYLHIFEHGGGILLEPVKPRMTVENVRKWLDGLHRTQLSDDCFTGDWRDQPRFPARPKRQISKS